MSLQSFVIRLNLARGCLQTKLDALISKQEPSHCHQTYTKVKVKHIPHTTIPLLQVVVLEQF
jgi:hypothetical protein